MADDDEDSPRKVVVVVKRDPLEFLLQRQEPIYQHMPEPLSYCGGLAATNAYLLDLNGHRLAIDAPEGFLDFLKKKKIKPDSLLLTHGH